MQQRHQGGRYVQPDLAATRRIEPAADEQTLEAADVVEMGMGQEQRIGHRTVARKVGGESLVATVDGQPRRAIELDGGRRSTQLHRRGIAHAQEPDRPAHQ